MIKHGSWGYRDSDGSVAYFGEDGSWEQRDLDESDSYYEENQNSDYDEEYDDTYSGGEG